MKKPRTPEVKTVTLKFKTTLTNKYLCSIVGEAVQQMIFNEVAKYRDDAGIDLHAKPRVEAVGKR